MLYFSTFSLVVPVSLIFKENDSSRRTTSVTKPATLTC